MQTPHGEWREVTLSEISLRVTKGTTPTTIGGHFTDTGIAFVKVESITDEGRIDIAKLAHIDDATNDLLARSKLQKDDVLFTIAGTIGRVAQIREDVLPANTNQAVAIVRPNQDMINPQFLLYALRDDARIERAQTRVVQSVQANFSLAELSAVEVPLPPLPEQRAIAHVLGTLDDKIELNRRMNETLEEMARALFKSWFVDFEPVRAKMEGRWQRGESLPGLPAEHYDFFPDRLVPSELGEVPEEWEVGMVGGVLSQRNQRVGDMEATVLSAVASGELIKSEDFFDKRVYSSDISKYLAVEEWDIAYNPSRINIGSVGMLKEAIFGAVSPVYVVVRPRAEYRWFLEFYLRWSATKNWITAFASGSVRQSLNFSDFAAIPCVIPSRDVLKAFDDQWLSWSDLIFSRTTESRTLAALRDTLLPALISGKVGVEDIHWAIRGTSQ